MVHVRVTDDCIQHGVTDSCIHGPVALAFDPVLASDAVVAVWPEALHLWRPASYQPGHILDLPQNVRDFLRDYYSDPASAGPFEFEMDIPGEYLTPSA